jgi:hypothetical protein
VAFFVATGFVAVVEVGAADEVAAGDVDVVEEDEADAEEPVPVVPIADPPAIFIELVVDN